MAAPKYGARWYKSSQSRHDICVPVETYKVPPSEIITSNYRMWRIMRIGYLEAPGKDCLKLVGDTKQIAAYTYGNPYLSTKNVELWILKMIYTCQLGNTSACSWKRRADSFYF